MEILDTVRVAFEKVLGRPMQDFGRDTTPRQLPMWDSVAHVNIILEVEREFGIEFSPRVLAELTSVGAICDAVRAAV